MIKKASTILHETADLFETPGSWTQHALARDERGDNEFYKSRKAVSWCALGGLRKVGGQYSKYQVALGVLESMLPLGIAQWNDRTERSREDVVNIFRQAEELAKSRGA